MLIGVGMYVNNLKLTNSYMFKVFKIVINH